MSEYEDEGTVEEAAVVVSEPRRDDLVPQEDDTPLSAEEVDLESQRKDETSSLAHDRYDSEGNRIT